MLCIKKNLINRLNILTCHFLFHCIVTYLCCGGKQTAGLVQKYKWKS